MSDDGVEHDYFILKDNYALVLVQKKEKVCAAQLYKWEQVKRALVMSPMT
jgi:hypothetical protein